MSKQRKIYYTAAEVSELLGISLGTSYRIIRDLNKQIKRDGFIVIAGKVPVKLFEEKYYGLGA